MRLPSSSARYQRRKEESCLLNYWATTEARHELALTCKREREAVVN